MRKDEMTSFEWALRKAIQEHLRTHKNSGLFVKNADTFREAKVNSDCGLVITLEDGQVFYVTVEKQGAAR